MSEVAPVDPDREYFFDASGKQSRRILRGAEAKETFESIPVINVSRVNSPDLEVRKSLATEINRAATDVGFFILENPPVDFQKMDNAFAIIKQFFDLPEEVKLKYHISNSPAGKGFQPVSDKNEAYRMGTDYTDIEQIEGMILPPGCPKINQWPDDVLPEFRTIIYSYYKEVRAFSLQLVGIFALALGLEENALDHLFKAPLGDMTIQHYMGHNVDTPRPSGVGAHADYGAFTCLLQNKISGLQVLNANAIWVPVPVREHAFVVNTGTYFEVLTNGRWPATVHRVVTKGDVERFSLPFFFNFDPSQLISPMPTILAPGEKHKYEEVHIGEEALKGMFLSLPEHPLVKKLEAKGLSTRDYTFDKLLQGVPV